MDQGQTVEPQPIQPSPSSENLGRYHANIAVYLLLSLITCFIFAVYWNYVKMEAINAMLKRQELKFSHWLIFSFLTCGIFHIFYQYKMGAAIVEIQKSKGKDVFESLPVVSIFTTILALSIVTDCVHQHEINKLIR